MGQHKRAHQGPELTRATEVILLVPSVVHKAAREFHSEERARREARGQQMPPFADWSSGLLCASWASYVTRAQVIQVPGPLILSP